MDKEQLTGVPEPENADPGRGDGAAYDGLEAEETKAPGESGETPEESGETPGESGEAPGESGEAPGESGEAPGESGGAPEESGEAPGESGEAPGENGEAPGENGEAPGENGGAPEESEADKPCAICGINQKRENSDYCSGCEKIALSRKPPFLAWILGLAAVAASVLSSFFVLIASPPILQIARGDSRANDKRWYSAYKEYMGVPGVVDEVNSIVGGEKAPLIKTGLGLKIKTVEAIAESYSPLEALRAAESLLNGKKAEDIRAFKKYIKFKEDYIASYEAVMETINKMTSGDAKAAEVYADFEKALQKEGVNPIFANYFYYQAASFYQDDAKRLSLLKKVDELARESREDYSWLYYQDIAEALYDSGETDAAMKYVDEVAQNDKNKFYAYEIKMRILLGKGDEDGAAKLLAEFKGNNEGLDSSYVLEATLLRRAGKYEKAKAVCREAIEEYDSAPELHRQLALLYLLEENYKDAYEESFSADNIAYNLYRYANDSSAYTPRLDNTLYLCARLYKETGTADSENSKYLDDILDSYADRKLSERVEAITSGRKTVKEVLTEGACDLA